LTIAVEKALGYALVESLHELVGIDNLHDAFELCARHQLEPHARDDAEQAIAADRQTEELRILETAARLDSSIGTHDGERLDIADDRPKLEAAAMDVGSERAAEREPIGAGLLLKDAPLLALVLLHGDKTFHQLRLLDASLDVQDPSVCIKAEPTSHWTGVDQHRSGGELLAAHRMTSTRNRDCLAFEPGGCDRPPQRLFGVHRDNASDPRFVKLRMEVVDQDPGILGVGNLGSVGQEGEAGSGLDRAAQEFASGSH
jgi:hypothetical protein